MDNTSFDRLARLAATTDRRTVLRGLSGSLVATVLTIGGAHEAAAACVKLGKRCRRKGVISKCCGGAVCLTRKCVLGPKPVGAACNPEKPLSCNSGKCGCVGQTCTCREATCDPKGGGAAQCNADSECCAGACEAGFCFT